MPSERKAIPPGELENLLTATSPLPQARELARDVFSSIRRGRQLLVSWADPLSRRNSGLLPLVAHATASRQRLLVVVPDRLDRARITAQIQDWNLTLESPLPVHLIHDTRQDVPEGPGVLILGTEVFVPYLHALELKLEIGKRLAPDLVYLEDVQVLPDVARRYTDRRVDEAALLEALKPFRAIAPSQWLGTERCVKRFFLDLSIFRESEAYQLRLTDSRPVETFELLDRLEAAAQALPALETQQSARQASRIRWLMRAIDDAMELAGPSRVHFLQDAPDLGVVLCTTRLDLTRLLEPVWHDAFTILAGPAIDTAGAFFYLRDQLGFSASTRRLSGLEPERAMLLVTPDQVPDPGEFHWSSVALREALSGLDELPGPTLALCGAPPIFRGIVSAPSTFRRRLEQWQDHFKSDGTVTDAPRFDLLVSPDPLPIEIWPCHAWRSLMVDRLPFPSPDDPLLDALKIRESAWFSRYALPRAALAFRSHLVRFACSSPLPGLVLVLDSRLFGRGYARAFLEGLPNVQRSRLLEGLSTLNTHHFEVRP